MLVSSAVLKKKYGVSRFILRQWVLAGVIKSFETPGGHYRYLEGEVKKVLGISEEDLGE